MTDLENLPSDIKHAIVYYKKRVADLELAALIAQFDVSQLTDKYNKLYELFQKQSAVFEKDREELKGRISGLDKMSREFEKLVKKEDANKIRKKYPGVV
jgi:uncharacterized protein involved in exopolysaccharide biosynthesis